MARNFNKRNGAKGTAEAINYSPAGRIFCWVDPAFSGAVLVSGLVLLLCLTWFSTISILANTLLLGVILGVGCKIYVHLMGMLKKPCKDPLAQLALMDLSIEESCVEEFIKNSVEQYNYCISEVRRLILGEDMYDSVKFGLVLYLLTIVGSIFNTLTLLIIAWVFAFVIPKVYEDNQDSMDELFGKIGDQYSSLDSKIAKFFPSQTLDGGKAKVEAASEPEKEE